MENVYVVLETVDNLQDHNLHRNLKRIFAITGSMETAKAMINTRIEVIKLISKDWKILTDIDKNSVACIVATIEIGGKIWKKEQYEWEIENHPVICP